jgi:Ca2+-binding RTX toxin-like protein
VTTLDLSEDTKATGSTVMDVSNDDTGTNAWTLTGSTGIDTITGDSGVDTITGGAGVDVIDGGAGEDVFVYVATANLVASNALVDSLTGGSGTADAIAIKNNGGATFTLASTDLIEARMVGIEKIVAAGASNQIISITASELLFGDGVTTIELSADTDATANNVIDVSNDNTGNNAWTLTGSTGIDTITGDSGVDTITGGAGADVITGGAGADVIAGGDGDDSFVYLLTADLFTSQAKVDGSVAGNGGSGDQLTVGTSLNTQQKIKR